MNWFNVGYSEKHLKQMDAVYKRKYGKTVRKINEKQEYDLLPTTDECLDQDEETTRDENKDEKFDYSDLED